MKRAILAIALIGASSGAMAGGSRASDLSGYLNNISQAAAGNPQWTLPQYQTPVAVQRPIELEVTRINNHKKGAYFYKSFNYTSNQTGEVYKLDIKPNSGGYKLNKYGDTRFNAVDKRTGRRVVLTVPSTAW